MRTPSEFGSAKEPSATGEFGTEGPSFVPAYGLHYGSTLQTRESKPTFMRKVTADWTMAVDILGNPKVLVESALKFSAHRTSIMKISISDAVKQHLTEKEPILSVRTFEQEPL